MYKNIKTITRKEFGDFFDNSMGYIIGFLFALFVNFMFMKDLFIRGDASMRPFFELVPWVMLFFVPAITMRMFSEEKKSKTLDVLLTLPIKEKEIVIGKYIGALLVVGVCLLATLSVPIGLIIVAKISFLEIFISYVGVWLLATVFVGVGVLVSSHTENQVVAYLGTILILFFLMFLGEDLVTSVIGQFLASYLTILSPLFHLRSLFRGIIDLRNLVYFGTLAFLTIALTTQNLKKRI